MTRITGLLSSSADGLNLDLFTGVMHTIEPAEHYRLKDGHELEVLDVPSRPQALDRAVGYAALQEDFVSGEYEGIYGLNANLQGYGIASNSVRALLRRIVQQDVHFSKAFFVIPSTNTSSIRVAESVGAVRNPDVFPTRYEITKEQFMATQALQAVSGE